MTGRVLSSSRHELQWGPPRVNWSRVLGLGLALAVVAITIIGRTAA